MKKFNLVLLLGLLATASYAENEQNPQPEEHIIPRFIVTNLADANVILDFSIKTSTVVNNASSLNPFKSFNPISSITKFLGSLVQGPNSAN